MFLVEAGFCEEPGDDFRGWFHAQRRYEHGVQTFWRLTYAPCLVTVRAQRVPDLRYVPGSDRQKHHDTFC